MANSRLSPLRRKLATFLLASDAVSAVTFAIAAPVVIGFTGLGVEVGSWYVYQRRLQNAADLSAIAGAVEVAYAADDADTETLARTTVSEEVQRNGFDVAGLGTFSVSTPPADGSHTGDTNAVEVILERRIIATSAAYLPPTRSRSMSERSRPQTSTAIIAFSRSARLRMAR